MIPRNFYPRPPRGGRLNAGLAHLPDFLFLSTPSARRATAAGLREPRPVQISIHALREEGDQLIRTAFIATPGFLSTPSARRATEPNWDIIEAVLISIHALREEGDPVRHRPDQAQDHFYPRPPRGGRRCWVCRPSCPMIFLSTPSARRATTDFLQAFPFSTISIHALREEGDVAQAALENPIFISIHALREEGDTVASGRPEHCTDFYPRPPRGGRPYREIYFTPDKRFLSTPSARRATITSCSTASSISNFYPRPPRGGRPAVPRSVPPAPRISIHALREEGDQR